MTEPELLRDAAAKLRQERDDAQARAEKAERQRDEARRMVDLLAGNAQLDPVLRREVAALRSSLCEQRAATDTADWRGASVWLSREDWGVVMDALIEHRASAEKRKAANSESTSDVRVDTCGRLVRQLDTLLSSPPVDPKESDDSLAGQGQAPSPLGDEQCRFPACRDPEHCAMGGRCEDARPAPADRSEAPSREQLSAIAAFLFDLLDEIDTASDIAKGDDELYRSLVHRAQKRRFEVAQTDGYHLQWLHVRDDEGGQE